MPGWCLEEASLLQDALGWLSPSAAVAAAAGAANRGQGDGLGSGCLWIWSQAQETNEDVWKQYMAKVNGKECLIARRDVTAFLRHLWTNKMHLQLGKEQTPTCQVFLPTFEQSSHLLEFQHCFSLKYNLYFSYIISIHDVEIKLMTVLNSQISSESLKFALDYSNHLASLYIFTQALLMFKQTRPSWDVQGEIYTPKKRNALFSQTTS